VTEHGTMALKAVESQDRISFSKVPIIRKFESMLTDDDFESAGLKVAHNARKNSFFIFPATEWLFHGNDDGALTNSMTTHFVSVRNVESFTGVTECSLDLDPLIERINELREIASDDEIPFRENSAEQAIDWIRELAPTVKPSIFLVNNGNIRLVWHRGKEQLGIQFLGDGNAQFVYLGLDDQHERVFGSIRAAELRRLVGGLDLSSMLGFDFLA
jgi:hypothetical protein